MIPQNTYWAIFALPDNNNTWEVDHFYALTMTELCTSLQDSLLSGDIKVAICFLAIETV
jgi:hypothetical protein